MATSILEKKVLRLEHNLGIVNGKQQIKAHSISDIKSDAMDHKLYAVGTAYSALSKNEVLNVKVIDTHLINE